MARPVFFQKYSSSGQVPQKYNSYQSTNSIKALKDNILTLLKWIPRNPGAENRLVAVYLKLSLGYV